MSKLDYSRLDIPAEVERHTSTRLRPGSRSGKQFVGACPYNDCSVDDDGFIVWPDLTLRGRHYHCRGCQRSGDLVKLVMDIRGYTFRQALEVLGLDSPYAGDGALPGGAASATKRGPIPLTPEEQAEMECIQWLYARFRTMNTLERPRPRAYLAQRGIALDLAREYGLVYFLPLAELNVSDELKEDARNLMQRWQGRLVFPLLSQRGQGFTGRSLAYWQKGMDENEHRALLKKHNFPPYLTTPLKGCFPAQALQWNYATIVEGPFDALTLIAASIKSAVAVCGKDLDSTILASVIPTYLKGAVLALDGDEEGRKAAKRLYTFCRREIGFTPRVCMPPDDGRGKDWSERYRLHGIEGLAPLFSLDFCFSCGAPSWIITNENSAYCKACWLALGHTPAPEEQCCQCGDFVEHIDEEGCPYCEACWSKRPSAALVPYGS